MEYHFYSKIDTPLKDMHREKALSNKTQAFKKSITMDIWVNGTLNQLFITKFLYAN